MTRDAQFIMPRRILPALQVTMRIGAMATNTDGNPTPELLPNRTWVP